MGYDELSGVRKDKDVQERVTGVSNYVDRYFI
jgi:hypothetical protein